ncbi:MAG: zinc-binding alcohol dehydrogenase family protein [Phenylobacterium sp.]|uniref:zinc-binding alcohol dehydrogenase family protein n=1 Tax=Phenylobacterium sp. TaxID=1871053 RepID=UPI00273595AF|nr:zinc-binding alcohol dehydrogenase family protein [Phenylobacterium sp.]MDP3176114.1 zinc-binding alcohol dehydrogenase family protein [Phenylobacterium sp.]
MKSVGYFKPTTAAVEGALLNLETPRPVPLAHDVLVGVRAVSINPVDVKVRAARAGTPESPVILGFDGAGVVVEVGSSVTLFAPGDEVWWAGDRNRAGSNAEFQLVDERIVARKPQSLNFAEAAAMPLTTLTAWEALFESLRVTRDERGVILIIGGGGGVASMAIQLARRLTNLTVVATSSRPQTQAWVRELGAHHVIDHRQPLAEQMRSLNLPFADYVFATTHAGEHWPQMVEVARPRGRMALIEGPDQFNLRLMADKSLTVSWELMFTRPTQQPGDMIVQHHILTEVARLVDEGVLRTTAQQNLGRINAANLIAAHAISESGRALGKLVLADW